jgi:hypothetical protein
LFFLSVVARKPQGPRARKVIPFAGMEGLAEGENISPNDNVLQQSYGEKLRRGHRQSPQEYGEPACAVLPHMRSLDDLSGHAALRQKTPR